MSPGGSVSTWISQLKAGDEAALGKLHTRYWPLLVGLARRKLHGAPCRAADEEDVAQQALWEIYQGLRGGRLARLSSRHHLLALLTHVIACRASNQVKHELGVRKRGAGRVRGERVLDGPADSGDTRRGLQQVEDPGPSPQEIALLHESYQRYVGGLPEKLRPFAELYLASLTHQEIADRLGCTGRTVDRKIALILARWRGWAAAELSQDSR
jgi:DNA-directed RNA polymerase specialized sigma24 family protein